MNTKKEIVKLLNEIIIGVQGKRDDLEKRVVKCPALKECLDYVEGQLYEANYILGTITRDKRKKY